MAKLDPPDRGRLMARIHPKNTAPELAVRRLLFAVGYRYKIHRKDLPGTPDIAFISRRKAIFIHGCFWHQHPGCRRATVPATNQDYWVPKLERNRKRDAEAVATLKSAGWRVLTLWECEVGNTRQVRKQLIRFLGPRRLERQLPGAS